MPTEAPSPWVVPSRVCALCRPSPHVIPGRTEPAAQTWPFFLLPHLVDQRGIKMTGCSHGFSYCQPSCVRRRPQCPWRHSIWGPGSSSFRVRMFWAFVQTPSQSAVMPRCFHCTIALTLLWPWSCIKRMGKRVYVLDPRPIPQRYTSGSWERPGMYIKKKQAFPSNMDGPRD